MKQKIVLDYSLTCTLGSLYRAVTSASGLKAWFADRVSIEGSTYQFGWSKHSHTADLLRHKLNTYARFRWEDDECGYFEFRMVQHELTGDIQLIVTDFADPDELDDQIELWNTQIDKLKRSIGCLKK